MEDGFSDPVRLPYFENSFSSVPTPCKDDFEQMLEAARKMSFDMRPVKQNALKASFLFEKLQHLPSDCLRPRNRCRMKIDELMRKTSNALSKRVSKENSNGRFRRSAEERKRDWRAAMYHISIEEIGYTSVRCNMPPTLLPSLLLDSHVNQRLDTSSVPLQPVSTTREFTAIASVWTNMVFDFEMLGTVLDDHQKTNQFLSKRCVRDTDIIDSAYRRSNSGSSIPDTILDFKSTDVWCLRPLTRHTSFTGNVYRTARNHLSIFGSGLSDCDFKCFPSQSISDDFALSGQTIEEEIVFRSLRSIRKSIFERSILDQLMQIKEARSFSTGIQSFCFPKFTRDDFFAQIGFSLSSASTTILSKCILNTTTTSVLTVSDMRCKPRMTSDRNRYFPDLLRILCQHMKKRKSTALWSSGPKDVTRKCRLENSILSRVFLSRPSLLRITKKRDFTNIAQFGSENRIFGVERAFTLLRIFGMNYASFLPLSVDLTECLRFSLGLEEQYRLETLQLFQRCLEQHNNYDMMKKNKSIILTEHIRKAETEQVDTLLVKSPKQNGIDSAEGDKNDENTSQESALNDILTSDEDEQEPVVDSVTVDIQQLQKHHVKAVVGAEAENTGENSLGGRDQQEPQKVRLRVPENLMCSPWSLRLAEHCITNMTRGTILLPPYLSALPSLCVVINTHLSDQLHDHRVAVVCEADSDISNGLGSYLEHSFDHKMSVEIIRRWNLPNEPRYAPLFGCTAQILILDGFDFSVPKGVTLLLVLICEPRIIRSQLHLEHCPPQNSLNPEWPRLSSILIAPIDCWVPFPAYIERARRLSLQLKTDNVVFLADYDDVHISVLLAKPRAMFLVPLREATELISIIDAHSSETLCKLDEVFLQVRPTWRNISACRLSDFSVSFLKSILEDEVMKRSSETYCDLERVYYLGQARSYALCDGFDVAMAFLQHCCDELQPEVSGLLQNVVNEVGAIEVQSVEANRDHPIVSPVAAHIKKMKDNYKTESPSLSLTHRREIFLPLIVADSREAVDGFRRGGTKAKLLFEARENDIAVCWSIDLVSISTGKNKSIRERGVLERLKEFTHIYHIIDGRENTHSELQFPPAILHMVHAGRTRLITVLVDERRDRESVWMNSHTTYVTLRKHIGDQSRLSGFNEIQTLKEMKWKAVTRMLGSLL